MKWIRANSPVKDNEYNEFQVFFDSDLSETILTVSSETDYCAYINGATVGYGQYEDLEDYKVCDEIDVTKFLKKGKNVLAVCAYFEHTDNSHYTEKGFGLAFSLTSNGKVICESGEQTPSRVSRTYKSGGVPMITGQLGHSYFYDFCARDGWINGEKTETFSPSAVINRPVKLHKRPIAKLVEKRNTATVLRRGEYKFDESLSTAAEKAYLAKIDEKAVNFELPCESGVKIENEKNIYLLADLRDEITGILSFDIEVEKPCYMAVVYGEHIKDGRVRSRIGTRNFQFEFRLDKGRNRFTGPFRRLGMRYLGLFLDSPSAVVYDFNVISTDYPVAVKRVEIEDERLRAIYDASVKTLKVCMHEHYEDTPWREQSLYAMDSMNQMLFGYYAFDGFDFARASLDLMSRNRRADNMFTLTTPATRDVNYIDIPCFSLVQFVAMLDYANFSHDLSLFEEHETEYRKVLDGFIARRDKKGLIKRLSGQPYWNFYEWSDGLDHNDYFIGDRNAPDRYDAPLAAFFAMAVKSMIELLKAVGHYNGEYDNVLSAAVSSIDLFFDKEKNCFADFLYPDGKLAHYSELGNSVCSLVGGNAEHIAAAADILASESDLVKITLSHSKFKFESLLRHGDKYRDYILGEVKRVWGKMLDDGASTFYEDEQGDKAFGDAGSLSHGWSAVPVYVLHKLGLVEIGKES